MRAGDAFYKHLKEDLLPVVKVAISAKVALSTYISKGYVLYVN